MVSNSSRQTQEIYFPLKDLDRENQGRDSRCRGPATGLGKVAGLLQNRWGVEVNDTLLLKGPLILLGGPPHLLGSPCPPLEEIHLSMPETGEKESNCLFKSYTELE